jgi:hypothetical protein
MKTRRRWSWAILCICLTLICATVAVIGTNRDALRSFVTFGDWSAGQVVGFRGDRICIVSEDESQRRIQTWGFGSLRHGTSGCSRHVFGSLDLPTVGSCVSVPSFPILWKRPEPVIRRMEVLDRPCRIPPEELADVARELLSADDERGWCQRKERCHQSGSELPP